MNFRLSEPAVIAKDSMRSVVKRLHREELLEERIEEEEIPASNRFPHAHVETKAFRFTFVDGEGSVVIVVKRHLGGRWVPVKGSHSLRGVPVQLGRDFKLDRDGNIA